VSYHFDIIADYCSNFGHCILAPPFWWLRGNVHCSS